MQIFCGLHPQSGVDSLWGDREENLEENLWNVVPHPQKGGRPARRWVTPTRNRR